VLRQSKEFCMMWKLRSSQKQVGGFILVTNGCEAQLAADDEVK
jgi:hypothetical protein